MTRTPFDQIAAAALTDEAQEAATAILAAAELMAASQGHADRLANAVQLDAADVTDIALDAAVDAAYDWYGNDDDYDATEGWALAEEHIGDVALAAYDRSFTGRR